MTAAGQTIITPEAITGDVCSELLRQRLFVLTTRSYVSLLFNFWGVLDAIFVSSKETLFERQYLEVLTQESYVSSSGLPLLCKVDFYIFFRVTKVSSFQSEGDLSYYLQRIDEKRHRKLNRKRIFEVSSSCAYK